MRNVKNSTFLKRFIKECMPLNLLPDNIVAATFQQTLTKYKTKDSVQHIVINGTNISTTVKEKIEKYKGSAPSTNILGNSSACSFPFKLREENRKKKNFLIHFPFSLFFCRSTPIGVACLIAKEIASTENINEDFRKLGMFVLTVMIGLFIIGFVMLPLVYIIVKKSNPFRFLATLIEPILITFAGTSTLVLIVSFIASQIA
ncbi:hypothetical protein KUTeg_023256 [Tegillarca granosa]|uniref:Amino acid transporter n=1 Tax=Tegillarca granosa TaxID=220873 RepID=A0ABQ9E137_TEGGR|nr:hypothetical protein KUTeg_023256 [Tegillarca granosa]